MGNASDWGSYFEAHGNPPDNTPTVGAIAWESGGDHDHVAYVEAVSADQQSVTISEYNEHYLKGQPSSGTGDYDTRTVAVSAFQYIHVAKPSPSPSPSGSSTPTTRPSGPSSSTTTISPSEPLSYIASVTISNSDGYSSQATVSRGAIEHATLGLRNGAAQLDTTCPFDPQTDAVEPFHLTLTSTTSGFTTYMSLSGNNNNAALETLGVEQSSADGMICEPSINGGTGPRGAGGFGIEASLEPGQTISADGFVIIYDFFSPAFPQGDPSVVDSAYFLVGGALGPAGSPIPNFSNVQGMFGGGEGEEPIMALDPTQTTSPLDP
jgi:surface antigen